MQALFDRLDVWYDEQPRSGAENMAVDQLLMEQIGDEPLLRVYHWAEPTVSFGYSLPLADAVAAFPDPGLTYIRRWTGGGVVDHRVDVTYTLVIPSASSLATMRGAGSYREIHAVVALALGELGVDVRLTSSDSGKGAAACFDNPVAHDITDDLENKIAGAGQRRTKYGLLHQGSVIADVSSRGFYQVLASKLSQRSLEFAPTNDLLEGARLLAKKRYKSDAWMKKR